jgi:exopolysaccharide biosynthesis WecB/TagA/CpsF family protein
MAPEFEFGRLRLTPVLPEEAAAWVLERAISRTPAVVVTSHLHHVRLAETDPVFQDVLSRCELNVADGWPLVAASRLLGPRLPSRVIGIDLTDAVLQSGVRLDIAILGGPAGTAEMLAERESERHNVVLVEPLPSAIWDQPDQYSAMLERVRAAAPTLVLLGVGAPRQEVLADVLRPYVQGPILCCGATIPVLAGCVRRAPWPMRRMGLEWTFRLLQSPRRLGPRYLRGAGSFARIVGRELGFRVRQAIRFRVQASR